MFEDTTLDVSATLAAPFHRPLAIDEFRNYCVQRPGSAGAKEIEQYLAIGAGWTLSLFSIALAADGAQAPRGEPAGSREPVWGWTRGAFAIHDAAQARVCYSVLSHLERGVALLLSDDAEELALIAAIIEPLSDWTQLDLDDEVSAKAVLRELATQGYRAGRADMGDGVVLPFFRASSSRAAGRA